MSFQMESNEFANVNLNTMSANSQFYNAFHNNYHYYNLNTQLKIDLEQQNAIKMQQLEAIKLIQLSIDKLTASNTVPLHNQNSKTSLKNSKSTILVYKENNLHKNLLVSKILNKAKYYYYQSLVQTMRLSLMSKLNYYTSLIQQMSPTCDNNKNPNNNNTVGQMPIDENTLLDEMKLLMQQIMTESYHFNLTESNSTNNNETNNFSKNNNENVNLTNKRQIEFLDDNNNVKCSDNNKRHKKCLEVGEESDMSEDLVSNVGVDENNNSILSDETNVNRGHNKTNQNHHKHVNKRLKNCTNFSINKLKNSSTNSTTSSFLFNIDNLTTATSDNFSPTSASNTTSTTTNDNFHQVLV